MRPSVWRPPGGGPNGPSTCFAPTVRSMIGLEAQAEIQAATRFLSGWEWKKVRRMLSDPCALTFLDRLHRELREAEPNDELREALVRLWWFRRQQTAARRRANPATPIPAAHIVQTVVCERIDPNWRQSYRRVGRVLR